MDAFIKIIPQKKEIPLCTLHNKEIEKLKECIQLKKNVFICGATGVGKTFIVDAVLDESNSVELDTEMLTNKGKILEALKTSNMNILLDGYDNDIFQFKNIVDSGKSPSKGSLIVTSNKVFTLDGFELIVVPKRSPEVIATLAPNSLEAAIKCKGNIHSFFDYINGSDMKDIFNDPKSMMKDILCEKGNFDISQTIHEHGRVCDVVHSNYLKTKDVNFVKISDSLTEADVWDTYMYKGDWDCMSYYATCGMAIPKMYMGQPMDENDITPGSVWTKYGNYKMRLQKLKDIQDRHTTKIGIDELSLLHTYAKHGDITMMMDHYNITPRDFDVMNHLAVGNKLKPNEVTKLKKKMRGYNNKEDEHSS